MFFCFLLVVFLYLSYYSCKTHKLDWTHQISVLFSSLQGISTGLVAKKILSRMVVLKQSLWCALLMIFMMKTCLRAYNILSTNNIEYRTWDYSNLTRYFKCIKYLKREFNKSHVTYMWFFFFKKKCNILSIVSCPSLNAVLIIGKKAKASYLSQGLGASYNPKGPQLN